MAVGWEGRKEKKRRALRRALERVLCPAYVAILHNSARTCIRLENLREPLKSIGIKSPTFITRGKTPILWHIDGNPGRAKVFGFVG